MQKFAPMEITEMALMNTKDDVFTMGLERFNALLTWRGMPNVNGPGGCAETIQRFQAYAIDLQESYGEALIGQAEPFATATGKLRAVLPELLQSRNPRDVAAAQLQVFAAFMESASLRARTWAEFVEKFDDRCAAFARSTAQELHKQSAAEPDIAESWKPATQP